MINMLDDHSKKIQAVKSWGWFISLLGASVVSTKSLLNKILKVPEQLFTDPDPQVQIATMNRLPGEIWWMHFLCHRLQKIWFKGQ